jgi:hypothetical protein
MMSHQTWELLASTDHLTALVWEEKEILCTLQTCTFFPLALPFVLGLFLLIGLLITLIEVGILKLRLEEPQG